MHASASRAPVFLAMNRRGQEETGGALGTFCVNCHAPMAVREGFTEDGLNLDQVPDALQGVTCFFCHTASEVRGTHNNPVVLDDARPGVLKGGIVDPAPNSAHASEFSALLSGARPESSQLCGACHDIVLPSPPAVASVSGEPIALERTYLEWQETLFAPGNAGPHSEGVSCSGCHMPPPARGAVGSAAVSSTRRRFLHDHLFPGVDVALDRSPAEADPNRERVQAFLDSTLRVARLCVAYSLDASARDRIRVLVDLDNVGAGHSFPSGAAHNRVGFVELKVFFDGEERYASGVVEDGQDVLQLDDPDLWVFRDEVTRADGSPAHMFWEVAALKKGAIPGPITRVVGAPGYDVTHAVRWFPRSNQQWIDAPFDPERLRVTVRIRIQPIGFDVLDSLVDSGHLAREVRERMPIFTLLPNRTLTRAEVTAQHPELERFRQVSFEWSAVTLSSPFFPAPSRSGLGGTSEMLCAAMSGGSLD
jgi:hypothetical protein